MCLFSKGKTCPAAYLGSFNYNMHIITPPDIKQDM